MKDVNFNQVYQTPYPYVILDTYNPKQTIKANENDLIAVLTNFPKEYVIR